MQRSESARELLSSARGEELLRMLYGASSVPAQRARYLSLLDTFESAFPGDAPVRLFSAPGRTEIGGNHTDHQNGRVLAAAVNMDTIAAAAENGAMTVRINSEGFAPLSIDLSDLSVHEEEKNTTAAIIRGIASRMRELGYAVRGFDACVTSNVPVGSGLSSSAAFEVLICSVMDGLFNAGDMDAMLRAKVSQYAENVYFGKPSGLLDQSASSVGGLVNMDFATPDPKVRALSYDFAAKGYALAVVATGGSHDDLTDAYASITREMRQVASLLGQERLRPVSEADFYQAIPALKKQVSERAILRAMHFFGENERVLTQVAALEQDDLTAFLQEIIASGDSSWRLLQNVWATPSDQSLALALALSEKMLRGKGAWRVHGGGFAGTILAFVPLDMLEEYSAVMNAVFGQNACHPLNLRPVGAYEITKG